VSADDLGFTAEWFAAGVATAAVVADFARLAAASPAVPARHWRWLAFREFTDERERLTADECRAAYRLGEGEPDTNLGTAMMCHVLYLGACPADVLLEAASSERPAVRRAAWRKPPG
jgi:hypothetical protein